MHSPSGRPSPVSGACVEIGTRSGAVTHINRRRRFCESAPKERSPPCTLGLRPSRSLGRRILTATATCVLVGGLSACAGTGSDGVYLATSDDDLGTLTIDGSAVTYTVSHCGEDVDTGTGELTEDGTGVVWAEGSTSTVTFTDGSVGLHDMTFSVDVMAWWRVSVIAQWRCRRGQVSAVVRRSSR